MSVKCYDIAETVTDEATRQFAPLFAEKRERKWELKKNCALIDEIAERFGGISYEVNVDDTTMDITISLVCGEFEIDSASDTFYGLVRSTKKVGFRANEEARIQIDFTFDGIWVRTMQGGGA